MKADNLEEMLKWANETYYPFVWVIEGPHLYISNYGMDKCKADGMSHYPSIKGLSNNEEFIKEAKEYISRQSMFFLKKPEDRSIKLKFTNEEELTVARKLYESKN